MVSTDNLMREIEHLRDENARLRDLLRAHGIPLPVIAQDADSTAELKASSTPVVTKGSPMTEKAALLLSLFQGRRDVYARRWEGKNGRAGYSPACKNEWKPGICLKPKGKCAECAHAEYCPYDAAAVEAHLRGKAVLGVYPLLQDETCRFLAIDFDEESWRADVAITVQAARESDIPCAVEISRSGNGAHLWIFFAEPVEAAKARQMGSALLTHAMKRHARLAFSSYDRMFPNQDTMPKGGFGNLIALPLQPAAARQGGSLFVDERWQPYPDQWVYLSGVQKLNGAQIDILLSRLPAQPLGALRPEDEDSLKRPWQRENTEIKPEAVPSKAEITLADGLYIPVEGFSNRAQNQLKRIAAFRNPQFYRSQAMRMPVWNIPRVICCAEYRGNFLVLPRGCFDDAMNWMRENCVSVELHDERRSGRSICASFNGKLRDEQTAAFEALSAHDTGVLSATTAFGKTVIAAALIAKKRVNTLILVHRAQLMEQWKERLAQFLVIDEVLPPQPRRRGRQKKREIIGCYGANRDTRSGMIDIAMLQSMGSSDEIQPWIHDYGMVIVDECHHVPAVSFEQILKAASAKYIYGLTATPKRQDGHHPILYMYLGGIRYQVDARLQTKMRPFTHLMVPRFTGMHFHLDENSKSPAIAQYYDQIIQDHLRNHQIIEDVLHCAEEGRSCLLLSERTQHVKLLAELLQKAGQAVHVLLGGQSTAQMKSQLLKLKNAAAPVIVCATGKYIGEGFDDSRLDTLFLTMPISWQGTLAQYVGRLHRLHEGKREVRVYDYIDVSAAMLEKMYHKRLKGYASIGYSVLTEQDAGLGGGVIYDQVTFQSRFLQDVAQAKQSVLIFSPFAAPRRVQWLASALEQCAQKRIPVTIVMRTPESLPERSRKSAQIAVERLKSQNCSLVFRSDIHQKYAIFDDRIVWYGSINLLSFGPSQESIMRLVSSSIAHELMKTEAFNENH